MYEHLMQRNPGVAVIIEGPDGVGKTTFIENLMKFLNGEIKTLLTKEELQETKPKSRKGRSRRRAAEAAKLFDLKDGLTTLGGMSINTGYLSMIKEIQRYGSPFSSYVANIRNASPENAEFYRKLLAGEINDEVTIVREYLQAQYDLDNYIKELLQMHDLVIVDRALPSMFACQLRASGQAYAEPNWQALVEKTGQNNCSVIVLDAPNQVILQRCNDRGNDAQGEKLTARLDVVRAAYRELAERPDWNNVQFIDVSSSEVTDYIPHFIRIAEYAMSHMRRYNQSR